MAQHCIWHFVDHLVLDWICSCFFKCTIVFRLHHILCALLAVVALIALRLQRHWCVIPFIIWLNRSFLNAIFGILLSYCILPWRPYLSIQLSLGIFPTNHAGSASYLNHMTRAIMETMKKCIRWMIFRWLMFSTVVNYLIALGTMARVQDNVIPGIIEACFITPNFARLTQHPVLDGNTRSEL